MKCVKCGQFGHLLESCSADHSRPMGIYCGGIKTLDDVMARCFINEVTGCWEWRMAMSGGRPGSNLPIAWFAAKRKTLSVLRLVWDFTHAVPIGAKRMVWRKCDCDSCVNPEHLKAGTRKEWGVWMAKQDRLGKNVSTTERREIRIAAGTTVLDMEKAEFIRNSPLSGRELSRQHGWSPQVISRVRTGKTWQAPKPVASSSIFNWAQSQ